MAITYQYNSIPENWFKALPYAFKTINSQGEETLFYLPLNPSNLNIATHMATNVIATIGGTVEEHAPQRYFDISIQGTTGIAPTNSNSTSEIVSQADEKTLSRSSYTPELNISDKTGGFFAKTTGKLDQALNQARSTFAGERNHESGINISNSGYAAFHNFYRFLLDSKKAAQENKGDVQKFLKFISYKDNQEYTCAITRFQLERSADNPMLYNYSIMLKAYSLQNITNDKSIKSNDILKGKFTLSDFKNKVRSAKSSISALRGAFGSFGG